MHIQVQIKTKFNKKKNIPVGASVGGADGSAVGASDGSMKLC